MHTLLRLFYHVLTSSKLPIHLETKKDLMRLLLQVYGIDQITKGIHDLVCEGVHCVGKGPQSKLCEGSYFDSLKKAKGNKKQK